MNRVFHIRLLLTVLFAAVTGGAASSCVKLTGVHNGCVVNADCDPGRACVAGVCQAAPNGDASVTDSADVASDVPSSIGGGDAGAPETMPDAGPTTSDAPVVVFPDAGPVGEVHEDVPDGKPDVPTSQDAFDSQPEVLVDAADAQKGNDDGNDDGSDGGSDGGSDVGDVPPDHGFQPLGCDLPADTVPASASSSLSKDVAGTWQVCGDVSGVSADIVWLLGGTSTIHLDGFYWGRVAAGQAVQGNQDGMYFQVLEGTHSILQFVDINVAAGGGATLAARYFPSAGVLDFMSCDGASLCGASTVRLVRIGADGGQ